MRVPMADLAAETAEIRGELDAAIARVLDSGRFIGGAEVTELERLLAPLADAAFAVGVSSGTDALLVALMALGVGPGDSVVTTPFSFIATAAAAARVGARPVFADIDPATLGLDPRAAAAAIGDTPRAVIPVHLFGLPAPLPATGDVPVVEDAAQSIGALRLAGACATISFFPAKVIGALGDAGAVVTNDAALADRLALLRDHGARPKYHHDVIGGNFRLDAVQAAVLRVKLAHLDRAIAARRARAARYRELFAAAPAVPPELRLPPDDPRHVYAQFVIRTPRRDSLRAALAAADIATAVYYPVPLHLQPCFAHLGYTPGAFPETERAASETLALPVAPSIGAEQQDYVVERIAAYFA